MEKFRILIVDDKGSYRKLLKRALQRSFPTIVVEEATDGRGALQKVDAFLPDLIFMDIQLLDENGLELTKKIKVTHPDTIIFVITVHDTPEYQESAFQHGADCFLPKTSLDPRGLEELVKLSHILSVKFTGPETNVTP